MKDPLAQTTYFSGVDRTRDSNYPLACARVKDKHFDLAIYLSSFSLTTQVLIRQKSVIIENPAKPRIIGDLGELKLDRVTSMGHPTSLKVGVISGFARATTATCQLLSYAPDSNLRCDGAPKTHKPSNIAL